MDQQVIYFYDLEQQYSDFTDDLNLLERVFYEMNSRSLILKIIVNNSDLKLFFNKFWRDYLNYIKAYNIVRDAFKDKYLLNFEQKNKIKNFYLDFNTRQILIKKGEELYDNRNDVSYS